MFNEFKVNIIVLECYKQFNNERFQLEYSKNYFSRNTDDIAFQNFATRVDQIEGHNNKLANNETTYKQGINEYSDISVDKFNDDINGFITTVVSARAFNPQDYSNVVIPASLNYTALGYVTAVRNQVNFSKMNC